MLWTHINVARLRKSLGLKQSVFAYLLGVLQSDISKIENGRRVPIPSILLLLDELSDLYYAGFDVKKIQWRHWARNEMKRFRRTVGMTQEEFGRRIGIPQAEVSRIENGVREISSTLANLLTLLEHKHGTGKSIGAKS